MSKLSLASCLTMVGLAVSACASGEWVTDDFGKGHKAVSEPPPPSQRGESTPSANFPTCPECNNACVACFDRVDEDDPASALACLGSPECQAFLAQYMDLIGDYGPEFDNIIGEGVPSNNDDCGDLADDCSYCVCVTGSFDECTFECGSQ